MHMPHLHMTLQITKPLFYAVLFAWCFENNWTIAHCDSLFSVYQGEIVG